MTREESIKVLLQHSEHWKRLLTENICSKEEGLQTVEALDMAIKDMAIKALEQEPKTGHWRAVYQGDEIINYRCSECELGDTNGSTNLYGWDYCRRCGAKMVEPQAEKE